MKSRISHMYSRRNASPDAPGHWTTGDGEYEFVRTPNGWLAIDRNYWDLDTHVFRGPRVFGIGRTLNEVFVIAGRYYVHPVVPVDNWEYPVMCSASDCTRPATCSGGTIGGDVEHFCSFHMTHGAGL